MIDKSDLSLDGLVQGLRALGLAAGDTVEVHSSLSSLGHVIGGAETVVEALMAVVGSQGAIIMPAFNISKPLPLTEEEIEAGIVAKVRWLPDDYDGPTGMGAIADAFGRRPDVIVGPGQTRMAAWGRDAALYSLGLEQIIAHEAQALLIGVTIHRLTAMHYAERVGIPPQVGACSEVVTELRRRYGLEYYLNSGDTPEDAWQKVFDRAQGRGLVRSGFIGQARCYLLPVAPVVAIYEEALRTDPLGLFGVQG